MASQAKPGCYGQLCGLSLVDARASGFGYSRLAHLGAPLNELKADSSRAGSNLVAQRVHSAG